MQLNISIEGTECAMNLGGEFDADGVQQTREQFEKLCQREDFNKLSISMSEVSFLDSSGVGALVYVFKRLSARKATMKLTQVQGQPAELMRLLRMDQAMKIEWAGDSDSSVPGVAV